MKKLGKNLQTCGNYMSRVNNTNRFTLFGSDYDQ